MRKENIDGKDYYYFEEEAERAIKQKFDKAINAGDVIKSLMMALVDTTYDLEIKKEEAWKEVRERLRKEFPELPEELNVGYNRIEGRFDVLKE